MKKVVVPDRPIFPTPAALVTSCDRMSKANVATAGEVFMMSLHPLIVAVGFRQATYTNALLHDTGEFVVNLPSREILEAVDYCGCVSGRKVDKFKATGLTPIAALHVKPPLIEECPVNIECRIKDTIHLDYMDRDVFMGEVLAEHVDEKIIDKDGLPDLTRFETIAFASWKYYSINEFLAKIRFSIKKRIVDKRLAPS